jgi:pimeloyl-ACP methyl ester carboxylesterase
MSRPCAAALPVLVAALLLAACGGGSQPGSQGQAGPREPSGAVADPSASSSAGRQSGLFDVGGRKLLLACTGNGRPTIVLEPGEGASHDAMDPIRAAYDSRLRVCSYDRANTGRSGPASTPRTGAAMLADLQGLLRAAEVPGPYVLVGHSAGGLLVQDFGAAFPGEVAGVVALNPVPPWGDWSSLGFRRMTPAERRDETAYYDGANGESIDYRDVSNEVAGSRAPHRIPFHVLISTVAQCDSPNDVCGRTYPAYERIMKSISRRWAQGRFSEVAAPHEIYATDMPAVRAAIDDVLDRATSP